MKTRIFSRFTSNTQIHHHLSRTFSMTSKPAPVSLRSRLLTYAGYLSFVSASAYTLWILKEYGLKEREVEILGKYVTLKPGYIVAGESYTCIGAKNKGDLSGCVAQDTLSRLIFLKKGAQSPDALIKEFLIASFMSLIRPSEQPKSFILEDKHKEDQMRFYTLSEIKPDSMDLEDFVLKTNWQHRLNQKPLLNLEVAIASDLLFAKQTDIKLSNYVIIETARAYNVVSIDHEFAHIGDRANVLTETDPAQLLDHIHDFMAWDEHYNTITLAGTETSLEFRKFILEKNFMKSENIITFYQKVAAIDHNKIENLLKMVEGVINLNPDHEVEAYRTILRQAVQCAKSFLETRQLALLASKPANK